MIVTFYTSLQNVSCQGKCPCQVNQTFNCSDGSEVVASSMVCDGFGDCSDRSDEFDQLCTTWVCAPEMFTCVIGPTRCVDPFTYMCDDRHDCPDGADESVEACARKYELVESGTTCNRIGTEAECQRAGDALRNSGALSHPPGALGGTTAVEVSSTLGTIHK